MKHVIPGLRCKSHRQDIQQGKKLPTREDNALIRWFGPILPSKLLEFCNKHCLGVTSLQLPSRTGFKRIGRGFVALGMPAWRRHPKSLCLSIKRARPLCCGSRINGPNGRYKTKSAAHLSQPGPSEAKYFMERLVGRPGGTCPTFAADCCRGGGGQWPGWTRWLLPETIPRGTGRQET